MKPLPKLLSHSKELAALSLQFLYRGATTAVRAGKLHQLQLRLQQPQHQDQDQLLW